jgi:hypothetical protein
LGKGIDQAMNEYNGKENSGREAASGKRKEDSEKND